VTGRPVALVAGGASGIGAETARRLAASGTAVAVADVLVDRAGVVVAEIAAAGGVAVAQPLDIADEAAVRACFEAVRGALGPVTLLVNCAADLGTPTAAADGRYAIGELPLDAFDRAVSVGLRGTALTIRAALPDMIEAGGGAIVNISSAAAFLGEPVRAGYAVAKAGVNALTRHVASAYGRQGVRANAIAPGFTRTASALASSSERFVQQAARHNPTGRLGEPADIAAVVTFLLSQEAAWVNGQVISVDGGLTMR
jgi:NAD(P)-dependent dehydrogenase (short-subunit alcohol dehydrogenase family)